MRKLKWAMAAVVLLGAGCGSGDGETAADGAEQESVQAEGTTDETSPEELDDAIAEVEGAVDEALAEGGTCAISIVGDGIDASLGADAAPIVITDHWYTESQLRDAHQMFGEEVPFDEMMAAGDPIYDTLSIQCADSSSTAMTIAFSRDSTMADLPFGPGVYDLADDQAGAFFFGLSNLGETSLREETGSFEIVAWTDDRIEIVFEAEAIDKSVDPPRPVTISGTIVGTPW